MLLVSVERGLLTNEKRRSGYASVNAFSRSSASCPVTTTMSVMSWARSPSMIRPMSVCPPTRSRVLWVWSVNGRMRLPYPAARMSAFIGTSAGRLRKTRTTPVFSETEAERYVPRYLCSRLPTLGTKERFLEDDEIADLAEDG